MKYKSKNRDVILKKLRMVDTHPTAEEIYFMVKHEVPDIGIATVYRNLDQLTSNGDVVKLDGDVKRYDGNTGKHHHYRCPSCERVFDIELGDLMESYNEFCDQSSSLGLGVKVEFIKVCNNCKNKER